MPRLLRFPFECAQQLCSRARTEPIARVGASAVAQMTSARRASGNTLRASASTLDAPPATSANGLKMLLE